MTFQELAANDAARAHLSKLLGDPVLSGVLDMLRDANLPKVVTTLPEAPPNMDPMHAIALSTAQRAGFQTCLYLLRSLPFHTGKPDAPVITSPWEWTARDNQLPAAPATKRRKKD
jgi:hypothetical protein